MLNLKRDRDRLDCKGNPDLTGLCMKRIISVTNLGGITKSLHDKSFEFVIHVPSEYDYRYAALDSQNLDEIVQALKLAYLSTCKMSLVVYGVPNRYLGKYTKTSRSSNRNLKVPDAKYILIDELTELKRMQESLGPISNPDKELNFLESEDFKIIEDYAEKVQKKSIKKSKSAGVSNMSSENYTADLVNDQKYNEPDSSTDEERKI